MTETWPEFWARVRSAVSEGLCPQHGTALEPAPYHPRAAEYRAFGWCQDCSLYWRAGDPGTGLESGYGTEAERLAYQESLSDSP